MAISRRTDQFDHHEILLQAFDWNTAINYKGQYYKKLLEWVDDIKNTGFTSVWLPPPWKDTSRNSVGYFWQDFSKDTAYGTDDELKEVVAKLKQNGIKVIFDIVLNHRNMGSHTTGIWSTIPLEEQHANIAYKLLHNFNIFDKGDNDLNLNNEKVFNSFVDEMINLIQNYSAEGFRFDFAKGIDPYIAKKLIEKTQKKISQRSSLKPTLFLVGEYWDYDQNNIKKNWADPSESNAFDFPLHEQLKNKNFCNAGIKKALNANPEQPWRRIAVTFVDNHDTGFSEYYQQNKERYADYKPDEKAIMSVDKNLRSHAYAYILLTPGTPCIYWPHWHTWGAVDGLMQLIKELILIRKTAGINALSPITFHPSAGEHGILATVTGEYDQIIIGINNDSKTLKPLDDLFALNTYYARQGWGFIRCGKNSIVSKVMDTLETFEKLEPNEIEYLQNQTNKMMR